MIAGGFALDRPADDVYSVQGHAEVHPHMPENDAPTTDRRFKRLSRLLTRLVRSRTYPVVLAILLVLTLSSFGVLIFERETNQSFQSFGDAVWWTVVTAATVGYGDKVPVTTGGRLVGVLVMIFGVGLLGMVTGRIASWLVEWKIKEGSGLSTQKKTKGHFIICGWKHEMSRILKDILTVNPDFSDEDIVLVSMVEPAEVENLRVEPELQNIRFVKGDYVDETVLHRANIKKAARVLILADTSSQASAQEIDARAVMTILSIKAISKYIYTCVELIDSKFKRYLENVHCDEILLSREHNRILLANAASASGISHVMHELIDVEKGPLVTRRVPGRFVGDTFDNLSKHFRDVDKSILIGILENTGNIFRRKREALRDAQKTPDVARLVANLQAVKELRGNQPVFNPGPDYLIKPNSRAILIRS
jgi:voltage-gated potassium channel